MGCVPELSSGGGRLFVVTAQVFTTEQAYLTRVVNNLREEETHFPRILQAREAGKFISRMFMGPNIRKFRMFKSGVEYIPVH